MSHIAIVNAKGEPVLGVDGNPIRYTPAGHDPKHPTGFTHAEVGQTLECRKCKGKVEKLLTKAKLCKSCYRLK